MGRDEQLNLDEPFCEVEMQIIEVCKQEKREITYQAVSYARSANTAPQS